MFNFAEIISRFFSISLIKNFKKYHTLQIRNQSNNVDLDAAYIGDVNEPQIPKEINTKP